MRDNMPKPIDREDELLDISIARAESDLRQHEIALQLLHHWPWQIAASALGTCIGILAMHLMGVI